MNDLRQAYTNNRLGQPPGNYENISLAEAIAGVLLSRLNGFCLFSVPLVVASLKCGAQKRSAALIDVLDVSGPCQPCGLHVGRYLVGASRGLGDDPGSVSVRVGLCWWSRVIVTWVVSSCELATAWPRSRRSRRIPQCSRPIFRLLAVAARANSLPAVQGHRRRTSQQSHLR